MVASTTIKLYTALKTGVRPFWRWGRRAIKAINWRLQDRIYGIDTYVPGGFGRPTFADDETGYEPLSYRSLRRIRQVLGSLSEEDVVFDVGCGKGRIVCFFARSKVSKCVGIERVAAYAQAARNNASNMRSRMADIDIWEIDATTADYSEATIMILFNPFGPDTMRRVLGQIRSSLDRSPRRLRIIYVNALHEEVFNEVDWLRCTRAIMLPYKRRWPMKASFWETCPIG